MMANMIKGVDVANTAQSVEITKISFWRERAAEWIVIFQGIADGKTIQRVRSKDFGFATEWCDIQEESQLDLRLPASCYRIKPEPKNAWYRVALLKDGGGYWTKSIGCKDYNFSDDENVTFIHWLTDRIEYELPEGEL
jgi:hypothetical protein